MSSRSDQSDAVHLQVTLSQESHDPPTLHVKVRNTHPSKTVTLLNWDSPLDPSAIKLGVFDLTDASTGEKVEIPVVMFRRIMPPPKGSLVQIDPGKEATADLALHSLPIPDEIKHLKVKASGSFKAAWPKRVEEVGESELNELAIDDALVIGEYSTNEVEVSRG